MRSLEIPSDLKSFMGCQSQTIRTQAIKKHSESLSEDCGTDLLQLLKLEIAEGDYATLAMILKGQNPIPGTHLFV